MIELLVRCNDLREKKSWEEKRKIFFLFEGIFIGIEIEMKRRKLKENRLLDIKRAQNYLFWMENSKKLSKRTNTTIRNQIFWRANLQQPLISSSI